MKIENTNKIHMNSQSQQVNLLENLHLPGIAIIWIFKIELPNAPLIPHELIYWPLIFLIATLCF